jgi:hypothetical protein
MKLYLAHGEDRVSRVFQAFVVLARDEEAARGVIVHEIPGFRVGDEIQSVKDYPQLEVRPAVIARITLSESGR